MNRLMLALAAFVEATVGAVLLGAGSSPAEYAGGLAIVGGTGVAVWAVVRQVVKTDRVSSDYRDLITALQSDNDRLRAALRACEEEQP